MTAAQLYARLVRLDFRRFRGHPLSPCRPVHAAHGAAPRLRPSRIDDHGGTQECANQAKRLIEGLSKAVLGLTPSFGLCSTPAMDSHRFGSAI